MTKVICIGGKAQNGKDTSAVVFSQVLTDRGNKTLIVHYADLLKFICRTYFGWDGSKDEAGRTLLQRVGTEVVREHVPDYWVDFVIGLVKLFPDEWDYIIIPDTRFPNELHKWKASGFDSVYVRVQRENFESPLTPEQQLHRSEIALDNEVPDWLLINDGTLEDLGKKIEEICNNI